MPCALGEISSATGQKGSAKRAIAFCTEAYIAFRAACGRACANASCTISLRLDRRETIGRIPMQYPFHTTQALLEYRLSTS